MQEAVLEAVVPAIRAAQSGTVASQAEPAAFSLTEFLVESAKLPNA